MNEKHQIRLSVQEEIVDKNSQVTQMEPKKTTLAEKLEAFDPLRHGGESMAFKPTGKEIFAQ